MEPSTVFFCVIPSEAEGPRILAACQWHLPTGEADASPRASGEGASIELNATAARSCVILSKAKDLARQRVSVLRLSLTGRGRCEATGEGPNSKFPSGETRASADVANFSYCSPSLEGRG